MKLKIAAGAVIALALAYGFAWAAPKVAPAEVQSCVIMAQWC